MTRVIHRTVLGLAVAALLGGTLVFAAERATGADQDKDDALARATDLVKDLPIAKAARLVKDIFYVPDAQPVAPPTPEQPLQLALRYKVLLQRGDFTGIVPESFIFQQGDRFRLIVEGNATGHLYIFNKGTSGRGVVLFPDQRINGGNNLIPAHVEAIVPATGWYEFDEKPGTEKLYLFYTPRPINELEAPVRTGVIEETLWQQVVTTMIQRRVASKRTGRTKDIVYVEDGLPVEPAPAPTPAPAAPAPPPAMQPNMSPATFVATQTSEGDGMLIHDISLNHQ